MARWIMALLALGVLAYGCAPEGGDDEDSEKPAAAKEEDSD